MMYDFHCLRARNHNLSIKTYRSILKSPKYFFGFSKHSEEDNKFANLQYVVRIQKLFRVWKSNQEWNYCEL